MRRLRVRFLLAFLSGVLAAALAGSFAGSVGSFAATRYEDLSLFTNVLTLVRRNYVEPVDERKLVRGAVRGMLHELDPHSSFMDVDAYQEMQVDTKGEFHGLGIEITKRRDGFIEVVSPIEGTPAARALRTSRRTSRGAIECRACRAPAGMGGRTAARRHTRSSRSRRRGAASRGVGAPRR